MDPQIIHSIIKTLCYHEIFSYPLTFPELSKYIISPKKISERELLFALSSHATFFEQQKGFIVLRNSNQIIKKRLERIPESRRKLAKALWISQILSYVPTIQLIGISGSLSMYNAKKNDDIDLFFITSRDTLWITRLTVNILLLFLRQKRPVGAHLVRDKICPNMFLAEDAMRVDKKIRNLYMAHEVAQMKVLYSKNNMKERFLQENTWVLKFLPHAYSRKKILQQRSKTPDIVQFMNRGLFYIQKKYMLRKMTIETVKINKAFFHPIQTGSIVLKMYKLKVLHRKKMFIRSKPFRSQLILVN